MEWPTGQERRAWLDRKGQAALDAIQYYLGPGVNVGGIATIADALNPIGDMTRAGTAARGAVQPGISPMERLGYVGSAATDMASVLAPVAGAAYADDAARGLTEGLANLTMPADDMAARFFVDEDGAIRAWHGSPHDFDRFSMDKIGTGEGAQAYGHGLYFAENPEVAKSYQDSVAGSMGRTANAENPRDLAYTMMRTYNGDRLAAAEDLEDNLRWVDLGEVGNARLKEAARILRSDEEIGLPGRLYEVNIDANPEDFLDWDAPLSAQPESVRQILEPLLPNPDAIPADEWGVSLARARAMQFPQNPTGGDFIRQIPELTGEDLERRLREAGIPGIRYLDAGSRVAGDGSRNYVVFDDRLVDILGKDGQRTTPQGKAQDVLDLLTSGRASEVTDEMLDLGDPVLNAQLNEYLYRNYDLPMDEASRMARAREMGFTEDAYHGRKADFSGFDFTETAPARGDFPALTANGFYLTPDQRYPFISKEIENEGWNVIPGRVRMENPKLTNSVSTIEGMNVYDDAPEYISELKAQGHDALVYADPKDLTKGASGWGNDYAQYFMFDPTQVRSRFARFDPRLAHLRNLSAGVGGLAALPLLEQEMRAYLDSLPES